MRWPGLGLLHPKTGGGMLSFMVATAAAEARAALFERPPRQCRHALAWSGPVISKLIRI
jgi:hypothetical protein